MSENEQVTEEQNETIGEGAASTVSDAIDKTHRPALEPEDSKTDPADAGPGGDPDPAEDEAADRAAFGYQQVTICVGASSKDLGCIVERYGSEDELMMLEFSTTVIRALGRDDSIHIFAVYGNHGEDFREAIEAAKVAAKKDAG